MSVILFVIFCGIVFSIEKMADRRRSRTVDVRDHAFVQAGLMAERARPDRVQPVPGLARSHKKLRVLLVDDHEIIRRGLAGLLKAEPDLEIAGEAGSGESAVDLARNTRPDVVLMDVCMPGMDGIQATKIIHQELPEIRVIALSMMTEAEKADAMQEAGAVSYLTKSESSPETMISAIRACA